MISMKTLFFLNTLLHLATAQVSRAMLAVLLSLFLNQNAVMALPTGHPATEARAQYVTWTFSAMTTLNPATSGYFTVSVEPHFKQLEGLETAHMYAEISDEGDMLYVALINANTNTLPANTDLGMVTVTDESGIREFVLRTDGGGNVILETDF